MRLSRVYHVFYYFTFLYSATYKIVFMCFNIESNLERPVIFQIPTQSPGRYTAGLPLRRIKLFFILNSPYVPSTHTFYFIFWGSRRMETAPTSIEVLLRPTVSQSYEPSEPHDTTLLHACPSVYSTW